MEATSSHIQWNSHLPPPRVLWVADFGFIHDKVVRNIDKFTLVNPLNYQSSEDQSSEDSDIIILFSNKLIINL